MIRYEYGLFAAPVEEDDSEALLEGVGVLCHLRDLSELLSSCCVFTYLILD
jgi:hypothetical protein